MMLSETELAEAEARGVDKFAENQMQRSLEFSSVGNKEMAEIFHCNSTDAKVFACRLREKITRNLLATNEE
ncbi:hypothetical protein V2A85_23500 [Yersinia sp. 1252 StPb PI]|uniref:hypothetical protein n=1 Tax=Yersinia sp. 1252 StPb PI TaxID=3117404 RepID=UPI003B286570